MHFTHKPPNQNPTKGLKGRGPLGESSAHSTQPEGAPSSPGSTKHWGSAAHVGEPCTPPLSPDPLCSADTLTLLSASSGSPVPCPDPQRDVPSSCQLPSLPPDPRDALLCTLPQPPGPGVPSVRMQRVWPACGQGGCGQAVVGVWSGRMWSGCGRRPGWGGCVREGRGGGVGKDGRLWPERVWSQRAASLCECWGPRAAEHLGRLQRSLRDGAPGAGSSGPRSDDAPSGDACPRPT